MSTSEYDERTQEELREDAVQALLDAHASARPDDGSAMVSGLLDALSDTLTNQESSLANLNKASFIGSAEDEELTKIANNRFGIDRKEAQAATGVLEFSRNSPPSSPLTIEEGTIAETVTTDPIRFETDEDVTMGTDESSVTVNAVAVEGGIRGNVGSNTIESLPSPPSQSLSVTNPEPFGSPSHTETDGQTPLLQGLDMEDDSELRSRVLDARAFGGSASGPAVESAISNIEGVISVSSVTNPSPDDNSGSGGLPPYSSEYIVYGGTTADIVTRMSELMTLIDLQRTVGGVNGVKETYDVYSEILEQNITGEITRPTRIDVNLTLELVVNSEYVGDDAVRSAIVDYIGGYDVDNSRVTALGIGEDVVLDELKGRVTTVDGVRGVSNLTIDGDGDGNHDGTDDRTTDSDGLEVLSISNTEVAISDGSDGSISITTTEV